MSCSTATDSTSSSPTEDKNPDTTSFTVTISTSKSLEINIPGTITFTFNEEVSNFTPDDIQFFPTGFSVDKGRFVANSRKNYSLEITPKEFGTLYVRIPANSFEDSTGRQNDKPYSDSFYIFSPDANIHTISFKFNGGSFIFPQVTNLKVVDNTAIEQTQLEEILSYPPTGPKPSIQAVTRDIFEWRNNDGTKYDFSTPVRNDLTLEAVWSNSCGKVETFHPANRNELKNYLNAAIDSKANTNLNHIDTSAITDMNNLFNGKRNFDGEIDCWNTANATNMLSMFDNARSFNQDISSWDVSKVKSMGSMFFATFAFNQDISSWNVANVNNMWSMFKNASNFNRDIGSWNVANVTDMHDMFKNASNFNRDIGSWNVANVNNMRAMFKNAGNFNRDIGSWNVANVTDMHDMFADAHAFNQDISSWNVANVTNMDAMFYNARAFNQNLSSWSVNNVTRHGGMFRGSAMGGKRSWHPSFKYP